MLNYLIERRYDFIISKNLKLLVIKIITTLSSFVLIKDTLNNLFRIIKLCISVLK